ncbi:MAG: LPS export ABC transporter permease LptG [Rhodobacteraceae bacterium]|nr:LPS export ABC transporter permease LptG [Paracoccaceae bacterium]
MTLSLYLARRFLGAMGLVLAVFMALVFLINLAEEMRDKAGTAAGLTGAMELAALGLPATLYRILPLITILAAIAQFVALARSSELVVIRAAGRSGLRALVAPALTALALGALAVAVLNPVVAATSRITEIRAAQLTGEERTALSISREGLWLRQGSATGHIVVHAERSNEDGTELLETTFTSFDHEGRPVRRIWAPRARLADGRWLLEEAKDWALDATNPEREAVLHDRLVLESDLTADRIRDGFGRPSDLSIWDAADFVVALDTAGLSSRKHRVWIQTELALPLLLASMVLVGAGFTMRHVRFGGTGRMVLMAIGAGFGIYFLRNFAQVLGENGQIPPLLAAWGPPSAAVMLSLGLLLHLEDG